MSNKNYNRIFSERLIYNGILSREAFITYLLESDDVNSWIPSDARVKKAFHESVLLNSYAAGILYFIESRIRNKSKHSTCLLGVERYSLEHMMPKKWRNNWKEMGENYDAASRDRMLLTLGNLTIITQSLNASIRDADWNTKRYGKASKGGLIKYADGLDTLSDFLQLDVWDEKSIEQRADWLYEKAIDIWHIEGLGTEKGSFQEQGIQTDNASPVLLPEMKEPAAQTAFPDAPGSIQARRRRYWDLALKTIKEKMLPYTSFQNVTTSKEYWINGYFGIRGFSICCELKSNQASAMIILQNGNRDTNKAAYDYLYARKEEIEKKVGAELSWWRFDQGKASYVAFISKEKVSIYSEETWETAANFHANWARKFREFIVPYLLEWDNTQH